jgi:NAD(P)-dependent dehydrogenase (short-subunit alcohol dehydrogenase family)
MPDKKTSIVTGAHQRICAGLAEGFINDGCNVVATSLRASQSLILSSRLILADGGAHAGRP